MKLMACITLLFSLNAYADDIFKIQAGRSYQNYSHSDLQKRVWELERAVWQLQQRVFQLETEKTQAPVDGWVCTLEAMGENYTGTGATKAVATSKAIENCKKARGGDGFFCKNPKCEQ